MVDRRAGVIAHLSPVLQRERHPWFTQLGGVQGRVIAKANQEAVPGLRVRLIELFDGRTRPGAAHPFGEGSVVAGEATTDEGGRFTIRGARPGAMHMVCVDPRGPRAWGRIVDRGIEPEALTQLDDIVLPNGHVVGARVVNADTGEPIPGASARFAEVDASPPLGVLAGSAMGAELTVGVEGGRVRIGRFRPELQRLVRHLPYGLARSGPDGRFRAETALEGGRRRSGGGQRVPRCAPEGPRRRAATGGQARARPSGHGSGE